MQRSTQCASTTRAASPKPPIVRTSFPPFTSKTFTVLSADAVAICDPFGCTATEKTGP